MIRNSVILSTLENLPGMDIEQHIGLVTGHAVRTKNIVKEALFSFKKIFGGESEYDANLISEIRQEALDEMIKNAESMGGNAIISLRFETTRFNSGMYEVYVYGTAVKAVHY